MPPERLLHRPGARCNALPFEAGIVYTPAVTDDSRLRRHLPGFLLLLCIAIAVGFFLIWPPDREARTLFFPGTTDATLSGERRLVPRSSDQSRELYLVVQELILGPAEIRHGRLLPRDTRISSLAMVDQTAYVDLSPEMMFGEDEVRIDVAEGLSGVQATLLYNFRWLERVVLTIGGQEPFAPSFRIPEDSPG